MHRGMLSEFFSHTEICPTDHSRILPTQGLSQFAPALKYTFSSKEGMTWLFDDCGGHGDTYGHYHYHAPPLCLMKCHGHRNVGKERVVAKNGRQVFEV